MEQEQKHLGRSTVRFLLTDICNLRCTFCHNEFQGDAGRTRGPSWDPEQVTSLLQQAAAAGNLRAKFSGGEPTLNWSNLMELVTASGLAGARDMTLFSNLTLLSATKLAALYQAGVTKIHTNLPSFDETQFETRTAQARWSLVSVLDTARTARAMGFEVQFNLVVKTFPTAAEIRRSVTTELDLAAAHRGSWDALAIVADDWAPEPAAIQQQIAEAIRELPDAAEIADRPRRSQLFDWQGRRLLASKCTEWAAPTEVAEADIYVIPPGKVLLTYARGRAYRPVQNSRRSRTPRLP